MVKADGEKRVLLSTPLESLFGPFPHLFVRPLTEQEIAVLKPPEGVKERILQLKLPLDRFCLFEEGSGLKKAPCLKKGVGKGRAHDHSPKVIAASIRKVSRPLGVGKGLFDVADDEMELAHISGLKNLAERGLRPTIARLFIPMSASLAQAEIEDAIRHHHLLPTCAEVAEGGTIEIPLENTRYLLSTTLLTAGQNAQDVLLQSKAGLSLIQHLSHRGLPETLHPREFLVGAVKISLGPYLALLERTLSNPDVFHLAARLLDAVRTSGIEVPRQIELCNSGDDSIDPRTLKVRTRLYPADPPTARVAERIFMPGRAERIIREGVDFSDATGIFNLDECEPLFDNLSSSSNERGNYARILSRNKTTEIPRQIEEGEWHESAQDRIICEVVRGKITSGERRGDQIPPEFRRFVESLESVGGTQDLRQVFIAHQFPVTDTLRALKRNNVGVFLCRSIRSEKEAVNGPGSEELTPLVNIYFDQTTYEMFCDLEVRDGVRFYMMFGEGKDAHIREFFNGFWVTREAKEKLKETHTVIAMFGWHIERTEEVLTEQIRCFLKETKKLPGFDGHFAVCHGAGPGVMRIADEAAAELGILRIGVGMDSEKVGQKANLHPPVMVNFKNPARHLRQNILDRTSLCKIYNIVGMGTLEELLIAIANLKLFETSPAPHIFVDPFGFGEGGGHLWEPVINQFRTSGESQEDWYPFGAACTGVGAKLLPHRAKLRGGIHGDQKFCERFGWVLEENRNPRGRYSPGSRERADGEHYCPAIYRGSNEGCVRAGHLVIFILSACYGFSLACQR